MRGIAALIATAIFLLAPTTGLVPSVDAQVPQVTNTSTLDGTVCTEAGNEHKDASQPANMCAIYPLPDASVHLTRPGALGTAAGAVDQTVTSDADGNFHFDSLENGDYDVVVTRTGFSQIALKITVQGATEHDLRLNGLKVSGSGQVVSPTGAGVADAYGTICCTSEYGHTGFSTDSTGAFKYNTIAGYRTFSVSAQGFEPLGVELLTDGSKVALELSDRPREDAALTGRVTDQNGNAVAGAAIDVYGNGGGCCYDGPCCYDYACAQPASEPGSSYSSPPCAMPIYYGGNNQTSTDKDGRYAMRVYGGSSYSMQVTLVGYSSSSAYTFVDKGQTVTTDFQVMKYPDKTAHFSGRISDAQTGRGLQFVSMSVNSPEFGIYECSEQKSDAQGSGATAGGSAGPTTAYDSPTRAESSMVYSPGYYGPTGCVIKIGDDGAFDAMLTPGYAMVSVYFDSWRSCVTTTNADRSSVTKCGPEYFPWMGSLNLSENGDTVLNIALKAKPLPDATVSGYVVDAKTQKAIPGSSISFYNLDNNAGGYAQTDDDGSYKVGLRSGYHQVTVYMNGYYTWQGVLDVPAGESPFDVTVTKGQETYGGCYDCYAMGGGYAKDAMPPSAVTGGPGATTTTTVSPGEAGNDGGSSSAAVFEDLHGGLGPYDAQERAKVMQDAAGVDAGKSSPHLELLALVGILGLIAFVRRRRQH